MTGDKTPDTVTLDEAVVLLDAPRRFGRQFAEGAPCGRPQGRQGRRRVGGQARQPRRKAGG
ncbi:MAG: hypothetical protein WDN48_13420 [Pseudolabrys sp.]